KRAAERRPGRARPSTAPSRRSSTRPDPRPTRSSASSACSPLVVSACAARLTIPAAHGPSQGGRAMPRAMWKGAISFGLVSIPVAVYPATEEKSLKFNQLHDEDMGRIRYQRVCEVDGDVVPFEHIVKGYEYEKGHYVVLADEDFDAVPV